MQHPFRAHRPQLARLAKPLASATLALALMAGCAQGTAPHNQFVLLDGSTTTTEDFRGKVTLVNFWATSCVTCVAEMPELIATHQQFAAKGFDTVAVAMQYDPPAYVVNFAETRKLPFKVALDNTGAIAKAWGDISMTPTTFLLDREGKIVKRYVGQPDFAELHQLINKLLAKA